MRWRPRHLEPDAPLPASAGGSSAFDLPTEGASAPHARQDPHAGRSYTQAGLHEAEGTMIGRYKVLQRLGEGGFGVVYMAQQTEPVKRRVALKIIKPGMDTKQVVGRFEAERQALALMDHTNIARVLDGGATPSGRPFFVMELVRGEPLTAFADRENLDTRQRIDLLRQVALAVQHAHSKGVIHRDLKPTNVLVELTDGKPLPKVIDFGIAKATSLDLTDRTVFTDFRQLVGTPEYMSPEQAGGGLDVDTRTDIYSLGVMLYELLTGTTPLDGRKLRSLSYAELQRMIKEDEPPRPSARLTSLTMLSDVATRRRASPAHLSSMLRGELDWIVMKCLEKDRGRRYQTAAELVDDLDRYLTGKTVLAAPPSTTYRMRKFVVRYRAAVVAAGVVLLVLLLGIIGTGIGFINASRERARLAQASDFLERLVLTGGAGGATLTSSEVDSLRREAATLFPGKPIGVSVLLAWADNLFKRSQGDLAVPVLRQAVSELERLDNRPLLAGALSRLGSALQQAREVVASEDVLSRAADLTKDLHGPSSPQYADALLMLCRTRAELCRLEPARRDATRATFRAYLDAMRDAYGPENKRTLNARAEYPAWLADNAYRDEAEREYAQVYELLGRTSGLDTPEGYAFMNQYVDFVSTTLNDVRAAAPLYADLVRAGEAVLGPGHGQCLRARLMQSTMLWRAGRKEEGTQALRAFARAAAEPAAKPDAFFPGALEAASSGVKDLFEEEPAASAQALLSALQVARAARDHKPEDFWRWSTEAGFALLDAERYDDAERVAREFLDSILKTPAKLGTNTHADALTILGAARLREGFPADAEKTLRGAVQIVRRSTLTAPARRHAPQSWLGEALVRLGKFEEAATLLHGSMIGLGNRTSLRDERVAAQRLIQLYSGWNKPDDAAQWRERLRRLNEAGESDAPRMPFLITP